MWTRLPLSTPVTRPGNHRITDAVKAGRHPAPPLSVVPSGFTPACSLSVGGRGVEAPPTFPTAKHKVGGGSIRRPRSEPTRACTFSLRDVTTTRVGPDSSEASGLRSARVDPGCHASPRPRTSPAAVAAGRVVPLVGHPALLAVAPFLVLARAVPAVRIERAAYRGDVPDALPAAAP